MKIVERWAYLGDLVYDIIYYSILLQFNLSRISIRYLYLFILAPLFPIW